MRFRIMWVPDKQTFIGIGIVLGEDIMGIALCNLFIGLMSKELEESWTGQG